MALRPGMIVSLVRNYGPGWMLYRTCYALAQRSGFLALKSQAGPWSQKPLASWLAPGVPSAPDAYTAWRSKNRGRFFFDGCASLGEMSAGAVNEAEDLLSGDWIYFSKKRLRTGFPPDWHRNPETGQRCSSDLHWSRVRDFESGDIKLIWEPNRFGAAYLLARAYAASGDERYPAAFWTLVEDWAAANPPMRGPNWRCGQEVAFRVMAWCFGLWAFSESTHTTPGRTAQLIQMLAWHAARIEANISYALSQRNNHAISEAVGLWTVGLLFPELASAGRWSEKGRRILEAEATRQIYDDGAYIQHSMNYHRVMLHDYLWAARLGELNGSRLSEPLYRRIGKAADFLFEMADEQTGRVPNYGANDGALVLPLSACDFADHRPTLQAAFYLGHRQRLLPPGPWDEMLLWLFGPESARQPQKEIRRKPLTACEGGYYTLQGPHSWGMVRCARFQHRPSQADQLHLDLWWRNRNIVCDAGTYLYNAGGAWNNGLAGTRVHNTVMIDDRDQMARVGRFLWLDWAQGQARGLSAAPHLDFFEGAHDGYDRIGAHHRRAILRAGDLWAVVDDITGTGRHSARVQWLFADAPYRFSPVEGELELTYEPGSWQVQTWCNRESQVDLARAGLPDDETRGWRSCSYADKEPAVSLALRAAGAMPIRFITILHPLGLARSQHSDTSLEVNAAGFSLTIALAEPSMSTALCHAQLSFQGSESTIRGAACTCS
jgi:hypothetical protein